MIGIYFQLYLVFTQMSFKIDCHLNIFDILVPSPALLYSSNDLGYILYFLVKILNDQNIFLRLT